MLLHRVLFEYLMVRNRQKNIDNLSVVSVILTGTFLRMRGMSLDICYDDKRIEKLLLICYNVQRTFAKILGYYALFYEE